MKGLGRVILLIGICWAIFALNMDVSVSTGASGRVNNLGLMADRQIHTILGGTIALAGLLMVLVGARSSASAKNDSRPCPLCAESIKIAAIKCKHCGTLLEPEPAADVGSVGETVLPDSKATSASTEPSGSNTKFMLLCAFLVCVIISAVIYRIPANPLDFPTPQEITTYKPKAEDQIRLDPAAFGCMSVGDFDRAIDHYNRGEYSAWAGITVGDHCFFQKDAGADISWTVMQVRGERMQIGLKRAAEFSKNPDLGKFDYWTLARWASPQI